MKKIALCLALIGLVALGGQAVAEICTVDAVPAATLLLPYFEVDLNDPNGLTTLFSINNASATAALAHVTVWSDLSAPVLDFDVYLTGFDVQTINMRDLINGILPVTADDGVDVGDTISNQGAFSQDINFPGTSGPCVATYAPLSPTFVQYLKDALTGQEATLPTSSGCYGLDYADNIARGYVTVDSVNQCSLEFPSAPGYFAPGGTGIANNSNILWGDYFYVDNLNNFAQGETLVHVEACPDPSVGLTTFCNFGDPSQTFYGRYVANSGVDQREPLATTFAARYINGGLFSGGTDYIVWRDSGVPFDVGPFVCPAGFGDPLWFPLNQQQVVAFDEQENPEELCFVVSDVSPPTGGEQTCFPAETGRYNVANSTVPFSQSLFPTADFGWMYLNLNTTDLNVNQAWVSVVMSADGRFSVGFDAIALDTACTAPPGGILLP